MALDAQFDSRGVVARFAADFGVGNARHGIGSESGRRRRRASPWRSPTTEGRQQLNWQLQGIPLAAAEPWLRLAVPGAAISGGLFGQGTASWLATAANPLDDCSTSGTLTLQSVDFTAPELAGDHLRLASVELPWRLTSQPGGRDDRGSAIEIRRGPIRGPGHVDPTTLSLSARSTICSFRARSISRRWRRCCRTCCEFAATRRSPPAGCELAGRTQPIEGGQSLSGVIRAADLAATSAGRPLAWNQPVDATFEVRRENGLLRLESLKCNSEFLNIDAAGTAQQLTANATFDLNRLATQLGQFVDLSGIALAGTGHGPRRLAAKGWRPIHGPRQQRARAAARGARRWQGAHRAATGAQGRGRRYARSSRRTNRSAWRRPVCRSTRKAINLMPS